MAVVEIKRPLPLVDFDAAPGSLAVFAKPGTYVLFAKPQPAGASCGPIWVLGGTSLGAPTFWWRNAVAQGDTSFTLRE
jgi:hypothetical protein